MARRKKENNNHKKELSKDDYKRQSGTRDRIPDVIENIGRILENNKGTVITPENRQKINEQIHVIYKKTRFYFTREEFLYHRKEKRERKKLFFNVLWKG